MNDRNIFLLALLKCKGIGKAKALRYILENNFNYELCIKNINNIVKKEEFNDNIEKSKNEIKLNLSKNIKIITVFDKEFPYKLYTIKDPILYLYYLGNINIINKKSIAIIGTRNPQENSIESAKKATNIFCKKYVIVSGLALGIDCIAHNITLEKNAETIAVLPSGLDNIQPSTNKELARRIVKNGGCLVSEYSIGEKLNKFNYAQRDRIQSALSNAILVIEAKEKSGTMIAVKKSILEGKPVFQLVHNNNKLINENIDLDNILNIEKVYKSIDLDFKNENIKFELMKRKIKNDEEDNKQISFF